MAADGLEPRALGAALAGPVFTPRSGDLALHAATRHISRWAPEASNANVGSLGALRFVDRLAAPWIGGAPRSFAARVFGPPVGPASLSAPRQRESAAVSWVLPRLWYRDELEWMASA